MSLLAGKETLYQAYDITFGIHDYIRQEMTERQITDPNLKRPLSSVALHPAEDISGPDTQLGQLIRVFSDLKVYSTFGLSLTDFLALPVEYVDMILRAARTSADKEAKIQSGVIASMQAATEMPKK